MDLQKKEGTVHLVTGWGTIFIGGTVSLHPVIDDYAKNIIT